MVENQSLRDRVALVTGATRGLGRAHARTLAAHGARVAVNGRLAEPTAAVVEEITSQGATAVGCPGDLEVAGVPQAVVRETLQAFGRLDIVINNAGVSVPLSPFATTDTADRDALMRQNFATAWDVTAAAWPHLVEAGYGRIVMFASPISLYGAPGFAAYAAAKAALIGLARTMAVEGAEHGITVNVVNPLANTRLTPGEDAWSRWYESSFLVDHVAAAVAWLADERCTATGEVFSIGGSRVARVNISETAGYVGQLPVSRGEEVADHLDEVLDGGRQLQFTKLTEFLGYMGELYGGPGR